MIGIIDYGMGNLFSVSKALERLDVPYFISEKAEELMMANGLILPGVGSFKDAMERLNETGLSSMIKEFVGLGKPLLGICLGMQLLFEGSKENGETIGLGLLTGYVEKFPGVTADGGRYKVPHMGWNQLVWTQSSLILQQVEEDYAYFVHSYYVDRMDKDILLGKCSYNVEVPAVVGNGNLFGMQFHPEKSSKLGMKLLRNFTELARERVTT
ncbi:imidazole glycerol phosphate synthase subunit HisH [Cytobacillus solani]|uniref:Imidazole glycerol phosphate synthase subunit HisH n=1 Tax=Cytobacillus solani TaxID=1637975 RepID=A0A0Q3QU61_9BACI|nr:imidazole glycerol phosphate synthase subunit HisH [Cytobacillus solani]KQL21278.1 imidazole glycerol phosphate synthase subunit HisH [Cytobacillus solani]USK54563.1 imidazole glycerol phosphate synthase subunit HisH [Cytobacillus solani]